MRLSLIQRVVLGFTVVTLLLLTIAVSGYISQVRMAKQLDLTASTLTGLLDDANNLVIRLQNANRAVIQHANTGDESIRSQLRSNFYQEQSDFNDLSAKLENDLQDFPQFLDSLQQVNNRASQMLQMADGHMDVQDERVIARANSFNELTTFDSEWLFFSQDIADLISVSERRGQQQVAWDAEFIEGQGSGANTYLQRALAVVDDAGIEKYKNELAGYLQRYNDKLPGILNAHSSNAQYIDIYTDLLTRAIAEPDGLFQQHLHFVELNAESDQTLQAMAVQMDQVTTLLNKMVSDIRELGVQARLNAEATFKSSVTLNLLLSLISIAIATTIAFTVMRSIKVPLEAIVDSLNKLAAGDLTASIKRNFDSEMGLVAKNINILAEQLGSLISKVKNSAVTIQQVAGENHQMSQQTNADVADQREQTDSVAAAVTEMESAIQEVAAHAADTSNEVSMVTEQAEGNMANMTQNLTFVNNLKASLDEAAEVINQLSSESQQIGDILSVIQGIAEQTNLLALNAAIEAARAGEQGRGFAVVADEVRSLANRTQQSANEIRAMIESLQGKAQQAVGIVETNQSNADQSVTQTTQANESLLKMVNSLTTINDMSRSIATASEEQSAVAKEVAENVVRISDMAENIAENAAKSTTNSDKLNNLSAEQGQLVSQFKL